MFHKFRAVEFSAVHAVVTQNAAVQLEHLFAPRLLVQTVDVLGHHRGKPSLLLPPGKHFMGHVGRKAQRQHFFLVEPEKIFRFFQKKAVADNGFRRIIELLTVQAVHAAKVRNPRLGADPRAAEKDDVPAAFHPLLQRFYFIHRGIPSFFYKIHPISSSVNGESLDRSLNFS